MDDGKRTGSNWKAVLIVMIAAVLISVFGGGVMFGPESLDQSTSYGASSAIAEHLVAFDLDPVIDDETLRLVRDAVMQNAAEGDPHAAEVVFALASLQRTPHEHDDATEAEE